MDRYAVIGNPISHSLSPEIHARFAAQSGAAIEYVKMLAAPGAFARDARRFFSEGGCGANVTLPFKVDAFDLADHASERACLAGAANFLMRRGSSIEADNTDGAGLIKDLADNIGVALRGQRILLLGAGGAARGVIAPLLAAGPAILVVANRTADRAEALATQFGPLGEIRGVALGSIPADPFDLVLNATSTSTRGESLELPDHILHPRAFAYDMAYGAAARPFLARAAAKGARASDGLGMLVEQAAESFALWRGTRPATGAILADLRARLA